MANPNRRAFLAAALASLVAPLPKAHRERITPVLVSEFRGFIDGHPRDAVRNVHTRLRRNGDKWIIYAWYTNG